MANHHINEARDQFIIENWDNMSATAIARRWNTSRGAIAKAAARLKLKKNRKSALPLDRADPAIRNRTTRFPHSVAQSKDSPKLLIPGHEQMKLGFTIQKGRWKGVVIYALTLIERETCPKSCREWLTCYGNNMNWSRRHTLDLGLRIALEGEIEDRLAVHKGGIAIRLHVLGDFGRDATQAIPYVAFWRQQMKKHGRLRLFGYTAHRRTSITGQAIMRLNEDFADRCRIHFSGDLTDDRFGAGVFDRRHKRPAGAPCPVDTGQVRDCAHCGVICATMTPPVLFERH